MSPSTCIVAAKRLFHLIRHAIIIEEEEEEEEEKGEDDEDADEDEEQELSGVACTCFPMLSKLRCCLCVTISLFLCLTHTHICNRYHPSSYILMTYHLHARFSLAHIACVSDFDSYNMFPTYMYQTMHLAGRTQTHFCWS